MSMKMSVRDKKRYSCTFPSGSIKEMIKMIIPETWVAFILFLL